MSPYNVQTGTDDVGVHEDFNPNQPDLVLSHGTMVGSIAVGAADNAHGSAGIASACSFMPVSLGRRFGCFAMLQGLLYAINHGARGCQYIGRYEFHRCYGQYERGAADRDSPS